MLVPYGSAKSASAKRRSLFRKSIPPENRLAEAVGLAKAIDLDVIDATIVPLSDACSTLLGSGKVDEVGQRVSELDIGLVVISIVTPVSTQSREGVEYQGRRLEPGSFSKFLAPAFWRGRQKFRE